MSERKRKRHEASSTHDASTTPNINVSHIQNCGQHLPIVVSTPGIKLPKGLSFNPYQQSRNVASHSTHSKTEFLLQSSQHSSLDYEAREDESIGGHAFKKHYIGVYDQAQSHLYLVPARKLVARSKLRPIARDAHEESQDSKTKVTSLSARNQLGLAFGTKKSQKAILSQTTNAIQASPSKPNKEGEAAVGPQMDAASQAVIDSMADVASSMPSRNELHAKAAENRATPKPNIDADEPSDVYPVDELVGGIDTLGKVAVMEWIQKIKAGSDVPTKSRFVARRIVKVVESGDVKKLRVLRYLLLLVEWYQGLKSGPKGEKRVPKLEEMGSLIGSFGTELVTSLGTRFARDGHILNKWYQHYLLTHILALALEIDDYVSDTHNIREDLRLEQRDITKLYGELGCLLRPPKESEKQRLNIAKAEVSAHRHVELKLPLVFPKAASRRQ